MHDICCTTPTSPYHFGEGVLAHGTLVLTVGCVSGGRHVLVGASGDFLLAMPSR